MEIGDIKKVEEITNEIGEKRVFCEKCKMAETLVGFPLVIKRKYKEWKRQHQHTIIIKPSLLSRLGVK